MSELQLVYVAFWVGVVAFLCRISPFKKTVEIHYVAWAHSSLTFPQYIGGKLELITGGITIYLLWNAEPSTIVQTILLFTTKVALGVWVAETGLFFIIGMVYRILVTFQICPHWVPDAINLFHEFLNGKMHSSEFPEEYRGAIEDVEGYNYALARFLRSCKEGAYHILPLIYLYIVYFM